MTPIKLFFNLLFLCGCFAANAQSLHVDVGEDVSFCTYDQESFNLGENVEITGGQPPYTYRWSFESRAVVVADSGLYYVLPPTPFLSWDITFSSVLTFIDDSTIVDPTFQAIPGSWVYGLNMYPGVKFFLEVTDSLGQLASDTLLVSYGGTMREDLGYRFIPGGPRLGDTVTYQGGIGCYHYPPLAGVEWFPKVDDIVSSPYAPTIDVVLSDIDFWYPGIYMIGVDYLGCKYRMKPYDDIQPPLSNHAPASRQSLEVRPIGKGAYELRSLDRPMRSVRLFDANGKLVRKSEGLNNLHHEINMTLSGLYLVRVQYEGGDVVFEKLLVP